MLWTPRLESDQKIVSLDVLILYANVEVAEVIDIALRLFHSFDNPHEIEKHNEAFAEIKCFYRK